MQQVLNNQISNSARLIPAIKELLKNGRMTIPQIYGVPSIKELSKGAWSVSEAVKQMHKRKEVRKLPHHDSQNTQIRWIYELMRKEDAVERKVIERRHVHPQVVEQVNNLFSKPSITVREHSITIELEKFKITIED